MVESPQQINTALGINLVSLFFILYLVICNKKGALFYYFFASWYIAGFESANLRGMAVSLFFFF